MTLIPILIPICNANPVRVAHPFSPFNGSLDGTLDDVRLYDRALSGPEIMLLTQARDYTYDAKGNLTSDRVWGYAYDHENRLTVATNGALRIDYRYDALGRLIERRASGSSATTNRLYYAGWQLIAEYNGAGTLQRKYVYGPGLDEPVRMRFTGGVGTNYYYHADGLGSVTEVTDRFGLKAESYTYDVYGTPTIYNSSSIPISQSAIGNRLLFTGRDRDPDTTLYNYRYRYYSPSLGRFVQVDPVGTAGSDFNLCRYARNNPLAFVDPDGRAADTVVDAVSIGWSFVDLVREPSWKNVGYLTWDIVAAMVPFAPGSYVVKAGKITGKSVKCVDAAKTGANVGTQPVVKGFGNIGGGATTAESALGQAQKWLGPGYKEIAPGVYRSADNARQFRMTVSDLTDLKQGPHVHFDAIGPDGRTIIENSHVGIANP